MAAGKGDDIFMVNHDTALSLGENGTAGGSVPIKLYFLLLRQHDQPDGGKWKNPVGS